jgi:hypothetical protein
MAQISTPQAKAARCAGLPVTFLYSNGKRTS